MSESSYLQSGTVLQDRYEILHEVGRGGYSVVYRARDRRIGTEVAIKLLIPPPAAARLARERLRREVLAVRRLAHPNIVAVHDVADEGPWSFVVMEYVAGPDLAVRLRDRGPLDVETAARVGADVAAALDTAHHRGILHRDVKPQNILLAPDGRARLTDFGSARLLDQITVTRTGGLVGTLEYAAPEVVEGARGDARSDLYGLGVTLYQALTAELAPRAVPDGCRVSLRVAVPSWLDDAVARATAADPDERFPSVALFAAALSPDGADATTGAVDVSRGRCVICRANEPFGIGVCPRCARRAGDTDDVLVFVERVAAGRPRRLVLEALTERVPHEVSGGGRAAAVAGERPLLRVPAPAGPRVVELLDVQGIPARTESLSRPWWRWAVPGPVVVLAGVVAASGVFAGVAAGAPLLLATGPVVAVGLAGAAAIGRRIAVWNPASAGASALSPDAERQVVRALAALPAGSARRLLIDLVRRATALGSTASAGGALVVAACAAARDLAGLEQHLDAFEAERRRLDNPPANWLDALARCERGRDILTQRLLEASTVLSRHAGATGGAATGDTLAAMTSELEMEARLEAEAAREVVELLRKPES